MIFLRREGVEKFRNKLFAEAVNTEINYMQVKNKVFEERRRHKRHCLQQEPDLKTMVRPTEKLEVSCLAH